MSTGLPARPAPRAGSPDALAKVRDTLATAGYDEAGIRAAFAGRSLGALRRSGLPAFLQRAGEDTVLGLLLRLFAAELPVAAATARGRVGVEAIGAMTACGLLADDAQTLQANVALEPFGDLVIAFDRRDRHRAHAADYVLGPGPSTRRLAELAVPATGASLLDLGCGSGTLGLAAAARGARVTCIDLTSRALEFARFNAALNALDGVELLGGDLFAPVKGRRFDRILCNPPFVISPDRTYTYRDGPPGLCARLARDMEAHLEPGGVAQMFCNWPQRRGADWRAELRSWFEATSCDVLVLASEAMDTVDYASLWLRQQHETDDAVGRAIEEWLGFYERAGIESLGEGLVVQHRVTDRPPWIEIRDAPATRGAAGESIAGLLKARDRLARLPDAVALLDLALRPAPDLERHDRRRPSAEGWGSAKSELRLASGYAFAARVDPVAAALVGRLDGTRTVREAAAVVAGSVGIPLESLLPGLPELVRKLMQLGLLR